MATPILVTRVIEWSRQRVIPPPHAPGLKIMLDRDDADETLDADAHSKADCVGQAIGIEYRDSKGAASRRRITIVGVAYAPAKAIYYVQAFCHERRKYRAFRADRIVSVIDLETGEFVADVPTHFRANALPEIAAAAAPAGPTPTYAVRHGTALLTFIGRCDQAFTDEERGVVVDWIGDATDNAAADWSGLGKHVARLHPDAVVFRDSVDFIAQHYDRPRKRQLWKYVRGMVDADGTLAEQEVDVVLDIERMLRA